MHSVVPMALRLPESASTPWELFRSQLYKFSPSSSEMIGLLWRKTLGEELDVPIVEMEMYGKEKAKNPWNLFGGDAMPWQQNGKLYVFSVLSDVGKTRKSSSKHKNRAAGDGSWRNNKEVPVVDGNKIPIGFHRTLTFKSDDQTQGHWNMDEFAIDPAAFPESSRATVKIWSCVGFPPKAQPRMWLLHPRSASRRWCLTMMIPALLTSITLLILWMKLLPSARSLQSHKNRLPVC